MHIGPKESPDNFFAFFIFFSKIQDGRQNPRSLSRASTAAWICFMFGLTERPCPAHVLICFWCDSDDKNFYFFTLQNFSGYISFVHFGYHQPYHFGYHQPYTPDRIISKYLQYAYLP